MVQQEQLKYQKFLSELVQFRNLLQEFRFQERTLKSVGLIFFISILLLILLVQLIISTYDQKNFYYYATICSYAFTEWSSLRQDRRNNHICQTVKTYFEQLTISQHQLIFKIIFYFVSSNTCRKSNNLNRLKQDLLFQLMYFLNCGLQLMTQKANSTSLCRKEQYSNLPKIDDPEQLSLQIERASRKKYNKAVSFINMPQTQIKKQFKRQLVALLNNRIGSLEIHIKKAKLVGTTLYQQAKSYIFPNNLFSLKLDIGQSYLQIQINWVSLIHVFCQLQCRPTDTTKNDVDLWKYKSENCKWVESFKLKDMYSEIHKVFYFNKSLGQFPEQRTTDLEQQPTKIVNEEQCNQHSLSKTTQEVIENQGKKLDYFLKIKFIDEKHKEKNRNKIKQRIAQKFGCLDEKNKQSKKVSIQEMYDEFSSKTMYLRLRCSKIKPKLMKQLKQISVNGQIIEKIFNLKLKLSIEINDQQKEKLINSLKGSFQKEYLPIRKDNFCYFDFQNIEQVIYACVYSQEKIRSPNVKMIDNKDYIEISESQI